MSNEYAKRHSKNSKLSTFFIVLIVLSFFVGVPMAFFVNPVAVIIIIFGGLIGGVGLAFTSRAQKQNAQAFKEEYLVPRMRNFFSDFEYHSDQALQRSTIRDLRLFNTGDTIYTNELIQGKYRGCSFRMGNVKCTETYRDANGNTSSRTVFSGRLIIVGLSLLESGQVTIKPKSFYVPTLFRNGEKIEYDHQICNNFEIRSYEPVELPKYLLDHINNLSYMFSKCKFYYKIVHDRVYIAINNIGPLYNVGDCRGTDIDEIDAIIKRDSLFFTNLISLVIDASKKK